MKTRISFPLFALVGLLAASQSLLAAPSKADARAAAFVATLQAVSPDPLGGRLGLAASVTGQPTLTKGSTQKLTAQSDERAYALWKGSRKS
jgi:hypothetical protein